MIERVVRRIVAAVVDVVRDRIVDVLDQSPLRPPGGDRRKKALGDAVHRIVGLRVAELRDDVAVAENDRRWSPRAAWAAGRAAVPKVRTWSFSKSQVLPCDCAKSTASLSFAASKPSSAGDFVCHFPGGGKYVAACCATSDAAAATRHSSATAKGRVARIEFDDRKIYAPAPVAAAAGFAMISLNATMKRRISSAVPTETRKMLVHRREGTADQHALLRELVDHRHAPGAAGAP